MKKIAIRLIYLFSLILILNACGEADPITYKGETFVSFTNGTEGDYYVLPGAAPFRVQIGIPFPMESDLVVNLSVVESTGTAGFHFELPPSVTIPSGAVIADVVVTSTYENMEGRKDKLVIGIDGEYAANFNNQYTLNLQTFCEFNVADFVGEWTAYEKSDFEDDPYDPYPLVFESNPNGGDTLVTSSIWPYIPFKVVFNASDPANFYWNIPDQFLTSDLEGRGEGRITDLGPGTFSVCEKVMVIRYKVYVSDGVFETATLQLEKD
jgi:hypothetical protein